VHLLVDVLIARICMVWVPWNL